MLLVFVVGLAWYLLSVVVVCCFCLVVVVVLLCVAVLVVARCSLSVVRCLLFAVC